jgi:hypothetical protein
MINNEIVEVSKILKIYNVEINFIIVEWVFSLFCSIIPLEVQIEFIINFFETGWKYFYKVCFCLIKSKNFSSVTDADDVYMLLRLTKSNENNSKEMKEYWYDILYNASIESSF